MTIPHLSFGKSFRKSFIHPELKKIISHPGILHYSKWTVTLLPWGSSFIIHCFLVTQFIRFITKKTLYSSFNINCWQQSITNKPVININIVLMFKLLLILCLTASQFYSKSYLVETQENHNGKDYQGKDLNELEIKYLNKLELLQCAKL